MDLENKIYISYCKDDQGWAKKLKDLLKRDKRLTTFDASLIPAGQPKLDYVENQLEQTRIITILMSRQYLQTSDKISRLELDFSKRGNIKAPTIFWVPINDLQDQLSPFEHLQPATSFDTPLENLSQEEQTIAIKNVYKAILKHLQLKERAFDIFLCHNSEDKDEVEAIAVELQSRNFKPWFDKWEIPAGMPFRIELEKQIESINAAAVFIGKKSVGPWQDEEIDGFLNKFIAQKCPVIPVILPSAGEAPKLPQFLANRHWIDFRLNYEESIEKMVKSITTQNFDNEQIEFIPDTNTEFSNIIEQLSTAENLPSRSPITIAIESEHHPIAEDELLSTERHLTVWLSKEEEEHLQQINAQLSNKPPSFEHLFQIGEQVWNILKESQSRLEGLFTKVQQSNNPQPIAWTGKVELLIQIYRPLLMAQYSKNTSTSILQTMECGSHYFHPLFEENKQLGISQRTGNHVQVGEIKDQLEDKEPLELIRNLGKEILIIRELTDLNEIQQVLEVNKQKDNSTRAAISLVDQQPTIEFLQNVLTCIPFISLGGRKLNNNELINSLKKNIPDRSSLQTMPCILSEIRRAWLNYCIKESKLGEFADALFWSNWSWIGKPLFANDFGLEVPASYPHLMDLRSVARKEWYYNRTANIPSQYKADALARSETKPDERFHFYITGAGGTGKSCFIRYIYEQLEQQTHVFPIWYRVDAPSSDWKNVENGIKSEIRNKVKNLLIDKNDQWENTLPENDKELRVYLKELLDRLKESPLETEKVIVFIDQLERTFESGDNPEYKRLVDISREVISLLQEVKADQGIQIFLASRKQYLPDFLSSFATASENKLHFNVLQTINDQYEQVGFVERILGWCKENKLVDESVKFDQDATALLTRKVKGHPLNMMLALIQIFSLEWKGTITTKRVEEKGQGENIFGLDLKLFAKDDIDWYFLLSMAHARTEIVRLEEVWWYLRLIDPKLTKKVDDLGPKGVLERLWLRGHLGRTIYARIVEKGVAKFLEFFHANLRDHLIKEVMNQGGEVAYIGRRGGTPLVWRALDRLSNTAHDWDQNQQLIQADDVRIMMEHRMVITERVKREDKDENTFYLLFLRDPEQTRERLCQAAKECFVYSAIVHDDFGRWVFENLFRDISERVELCKKWLYGCANKDSRAKILQYLIETDSPITRDYLAVFVLEDEKFHQNAEIWREIAEILTQPRLATRYRTNIVLALLKNHLREQVYEIETFIFSARIEEFCRISCQLNRDELLALLEDCVVQLKGIGNKESKELLTALTSNRIVESLLQNTEQGRLAPETKDQEILGKMPHKVELIFGTQIFQHITKEQGLNWQSAISEKLGVPIPNLKITENFDEERDENKKDYFDYGLELKIKGESIAIDNFFPNRLLLFKRHLANSHSVDLSDAELTYNYTFQEDVYWLKKETLDLIDLQKKALSTHKSIEFWLLEEIKDGINKIFDNELLIEFLKGIAKERNVHLLFHGISLPILRRIIVNLVEESVPMRSQKIELLEELQQLIDQGGDTDTDTISQKLRETVKDSICKNLAGDNGQLPILIFEEKLENDLKNEYLQIDSGFPVLRLPPQLAQKLASSIIRHTNRILEEEDNIPVVACEAAIRFPLARMLKRFDKRINVISYTELSTALIPEIKYQINGYQD